MTTKRITGRVAATGLNHAANLLGRKPVELTVQISDGPATAIGRMVEVDLKPEDALVTSTSLAVYALLADFEQRHPEAGHNERELFRKVVKAALVEALGDAVAQAERSVSMRQHNEAVMARQARS